MQKFKIGQKVYRKDKNYTQECIIVKYIQKHLEHINGHTFLVYIDSYEVKFADGNTAIVSERDLSESR